MISASSNHLRPRLKHNVLYVSKLRVTFIFVGLIYKIALDFSYWAFVSPIYANTGLVWNPNSAKFIESWMLYLVLLGLTSYRLSRPSNFFLVILLFVFITPLLSFYGLADQNRYHLYIVLLGYALVSIFRRGRPLRFVYLAEGPQIVLAFLIVGAIGVSAWLVISGAYSFFNLDFNSVYKYRDAVGKKIDVGLMGYFNAWAYNVFGPALLTLALWRKVYYLAALVFMLHLFWFGVSSHVAVLFAPLLPVFVWLFFRRMRSLSLIPLVLAIVIAGSTMISLALDSVYPAVLIPRRTHFVPARNTFDYYEYFSTNQRVFWSNSSVTLGLVDYPYSIKSAELIGQMRGVRSHRNNSFLSTGYMHAGFAGIVLYGVLVGLLFRLIDSLAVRGIPVWVVVAVLFVPCQKLITSADLPSALMTHGIAMSFVVLFFMRGRNFR